MCIFTAVILAKLRIALIGMIVVALAGCSGIAEARQRRAMRDLGPSPYLSPNEVVRIQMIAIGLNDGTNAGLEFAYRFASPANRRAIGSFRRFVELFRAAAYRPMLNPKSVLYDEAEVSDRTATVRIYLTSDDGYVVTYLFVLSNQTAEPCNGCWMTDAVQVESVREVERTDLI
jgi:hypothetical protein